MRHDADMYVCIDVALAECTCVRFARVTCVCVRLSLLAHIPIVDALSQEHNLSEQISLG
jgi:hypothetical protein